MIFRPICTYVQTYGHAVRMAMIALGSTASREIVKLSDLDTI